MSACDAAYKYVFVIPIKNTYFQIELFNETIHAIKRLTLSLPYARELKTNFMFYNFHPNVKATIAFLRLLKVKVNSVTVNEALQNHPDWPTLLSISDSLNKWHVPNAAAKAAAHSIDELPLPCIIHVNDSENPLAIVTAVSDSTIEVYYKNYQKPSTEHKTGFLKKWNGIYLVAEAREQSGERQYQQNMKKETIKKLTSAAAVAGVVTLLVLLFAKSLNSLQDTTDRFLTGLYIQTSILFAGTIVTALLLWYEMDKNNPILKKVCTGIVKGNCNAILTSNQSKLFSWLSWSEVGFFYFAGGLLVVLLSGDILPISLSIVAGLNLLAMPYIIFSVYYQWKIAKQWCILCLAVQTLLLSGCVNVVLSGLFSFSVITLNEIPVTAFFYLLTPLLWFAIKPQILKLQEAKNTKREYLRTKFNVEIFETLLKNQKPITVSPANLGIELGNPNGNIELVKVCNPYCGPCSKAHPEIEKLLEENDNLKVRIIFTATTDENDIKNKPVTHLLAIADNKNEQVTRQALDDWYLADKKDYESFAYRYPMNGGLKKQIERVAAMEEWCKSMKITATPTLFLKGYQLPDSYDIKDIGYFLLE